MHKNLMDVFPGIFAFLRSKSKRHCAVDMFVYLYISYHYCLSKDDKIALSYKELREGSAIDNGVGFSIESIRLSVKRLRDIGLLKTRKRSRKGRGGKYVYKQEFRPMLPNGENFIYLTSNSQTIGVTSNEGDASNLHIKPKGLSGHLLPYLNNQETSKHASIPSFFNEQEDEQAHSSKKPVNKYQSLANKLKYALSKKNKLRRKANIAQWTKSISKFVLNQEDTKHFAKTFETVLDWYIEHFGEEYVPRVYSAKGFCDNFERIEDAMERENHKKQKDQQDEPQVVPPPEEKRMTKEDKRRRNDSMAHLL